MQTDHPAIRSTAGTLLTLLLALVASVCIAGAIAYAALDAMPCSWFGSTFEGACGYRAMMVSVVGGLALSAVLFLGFVVVYFKRRQVVAPAPALSMQEQAAAPRLLTRWRAVFVLMLAVHALPLLGMLGLDYPRQISSALWWLGMLLLLANAGMVYLVAQLYHQQPAVLALVSVLIGVIGAIGVFIFLHTAGGKTPAATT
ncbi:MULTISPECIES: hypothetical protein [unclassified Duganella]|uniref:hypothetical protein n=1 Tax=unclassified Duganella TaxID=2636909 RepID=UPI000E34186C|nr:MULTISPECIES: hypothetical protein [unclassified Duganella]RFP11352.1 hypothetical protein D0T23_20765 [Duganella sp. BJB475]RFP29671.1 hypothetical protein D0T21_17520 [Duganella sp. BJB476]